MINMRRTTLGTNRKDTAYRWTLIRVFILIGWFLLSSLFVHSPGTDGISGRAGGVGVHTQLQMKDPAFRQMVEKHDRFAPEFQQWRHLFARHSAFLSRLVRTFPGGEELSDSLLREVFSGWGNAHEETEHRDVFGPWTNRWSGMWSNRKLQYHVWGPSRFIDGRWIQPVTLSETEFVEWRSVASMIQRCETDIAINVFSPHDGITGWVSKRQHGSIELPHVGYLVNDTTLVWICRAQDPQHERSPDDHWFVFLERVLGSDVSAEYRIYGGQIVIGETQTVEMREQGEHHGTYYPAQSTAPRNQVLSWTSN